ncbi:helix-turn-helix transcriptional regulator, partial [Mycolicibacterium stellerae]|uniref:helix-turn-helix transcriptional regulator n=1 Tax=Mycolicibacterium stellerae TaxID=2358193 RepID=UPI0019CFD825
CVEVTETRLAVEIAARFGADFPDGVHYVDLAPVTRPEVVPVAVARAIGLPDQPGRSTVDNVLRAIGERRVLMVLDNCEHLLEPVASVVTDLLGGCPELRLLATSREPLGVPGEVTFLVPSLSIDDEAIELFADRARRIRPGFAVSERNSALIGEICGRLDGMPLAIELAAARVRALSLDDILASLHDRFRLLTGGARTAVRRQQTLRASVDWSHALLTDPERVLFRRLAVFLGGFDLDAAQAVAGTSEVERYQVLDQLTLLVDKSLVVAENTSGRTRYRLLETVRQYALENLGESGEAEDVRARHRDHYMAVAAVLDSPARPDYRDHLQRIDSDIDNLRAAFRWSLETGDAEDALRLASALFPVWQDGGRNGEGLAWLEAALGREASTSPVAPAVHARALIDRVMLVAWTVRTESLEESETALALAREVGDPALVIRGLIARGVSTYFDEEMAAACFAEAAELARGLDDPWIWSQLYVEKARSGVGAGDPVAVQDAATRGLEISTAIGNHATTRVFCWAQGWVRTYQGDLHGALIELDRAVEDAAAAQNTMLQLYALLVQGFTRANLGDSDGAHASADTALTAAADLMEFFEGLGQATVAVAYQAAGDDEAAVQTYALARQRSGLNRMMAGLYGFSALAPLACGDDPLAREWADDVVAITGGCYLSFALMTRAQVRLAQGEMDGAEDDAQAALSAATETSSELRMPPALECLATLATKAGSHREAARLFGAAQAMRQRTGEVRFPKFEAEYRAGVDELRDVMGADDFEAALAEGAALSAGEAIAYAKRGRGERKRPASGWASLTPTELDVVRLLTEGLPNKDIATRLFISPRTVETHLTHVYAKLGLSSRVQLAQEAARHT